jgi:DNA-formamidopyrimidine glycosylase
VIKYFIMPEGPEVRTVADKLRPILLSNILLNVSLGSRARIKGFDNLKLPSKILSVQSYGKKILLEVQNCIIIISLGMVGRLQYVSGNHSHIIFHMQCDDKVFNLYYDDYRYMGNINIIPFIEINSYFKKLGPDLLAHSLNTWIDTKTWLHIFKIRRNQNKQIYNILLDQSLVAGIGLYLLTEILYYSGISPKRLGKDVVDEEWETLRTTSHKIILISYSYGGCTIKDFISPDGKIGTFPVVVYGKKSFDPLGNQIIHEKVSKTKNARTIHWVPNIQY